MVDQLREILSVILYVPDGQRLLDLFPYRNLQEALGDVDARDASTRPGEPPRDRALAAGEVADLLAPDVPYQIA